ncbi:MAG: hypothetical protein NTZ27_11180 [Ignavibacteriales bacterium]|nr:hypothetical protein [Ignavibacteriales bacterium]
MGGKAAILLVLGFSLIFLILGQNFMNLTTRAVDNSMNYYTSAQAYNIALSGANMAANQIFMDKTWSAGYSNLTIGYGTVTVYVSNNTSGTSGKTILCHKPGTPAQKTMDILNSAVSGHIGHGDTYGTCSGDPAYNSTIATIISEGTYNGVTKTVIVDLKPSSFAKFGNYYSSMSAIPATGDVFDGPFHVEANLQVYGSPQFNGKVTALGSLQQVGPSGAPVFNGGFQSGVSLPMSFDTTGLRSGADKIFKSGFSNKGISVQLYFNSGGTVTYSTQNQGSSSWSSPITTPITTIAPNGKIYVEGGNIYTKGTLNGQVTITATTHSQSGYGNIYQVDDLQYQNNPVTNPSSTDMLGMIAEQNIRIQSNSGTTNSDVITQASMYSMNGNVGPDDNLATGQSTLHDWKILGGIIAHDTRVTANYDYNGNPVNGLRFKHTYDTRFLTAVPPGFPNTGSFEIVGWYE